MRLIFAFFRHINRHNVRILLRALRRESLGEILQNLRRLLFRQGQATYVAEPSAALLYQQWLERAYVFPDLENEILLSDWYFPQDPDYVRDPQAQAALVYFLKAHPSTQVVYCDEDVAENGRRHTPYFKPGWSPERLLTHDYIGPPLAVKRELWKENTPENQAGIYLAFWQQVAAEGWQVLHIPKVLLHRKSPFKLKLKFNLKLNFHPLISILIPTKNNYKLLKACLDSLSKTSYSNYEVIILDNASDDQQTLTYLNQLKQQDYFQVIRITNREDQFSFAYLNNAGASYAQGDLLLFLNDDTEIIQTDWLEHMLAFGQVEDVGIVGAKLLYPDRRIQHVGIALGMHTGRFAGFPVHYFSGEKEDNPACALYAHMSHNTAAVTGACMLIKKSFFEELGGFDEKHFSLTFNDIDLCIRARRLGKRVVMAAEAVLIHKESQSRKGLPELHEMFHFKRLYGNEKDPYYNPNFSLTQAFQLRPIAAAFPDRSVELARFTGNIKQIESLHYPLPIDIEKLLCLTAASHRLRSYSLALAHKVPVEIYKVQIDSTAYETFCQQVTVKAARQKLGIAAHQILVLNWGGKSWQLSNKMINTMLESLPNRTHISIFHLNPRHQEMNDELQMLLRAADIFLFSAVNAIHTYPILWAMAMGLPIISHVDVGIDEYVMENQNALLVPTHDLKSWRIAIQKMIADQEMRKNFGMASRKVLVLNS